MHEIAIKVQSLTTGCCMPGPLYGALKFSKNAHPRHHRVFSYTAYIEILNKE